jgi:hypothetical protein
LRIQELDDIEFCNYIPNYTASHINLPLIFILIVVRGIS